MTNRLHWLKVLPLVVLISGTSAHAANISQVGFTAGKNVAMGNRWPTFGSGLSFGVEALTNGLDALGPNFRLTGAVQFNQFDLKSSNATKYYLVSFGVGVTAQAMATPGRGGKSAGQGVPTVNPFFTLLAGGVVDWLAATGGSGQLVYSFGGTVQAIPGVEFPIVDRLSAAISLPIQAYFLAQPLYIWNGNFHLRWAL